MYIYIAPAADVCVGLLRDLWGGGLQLYIIIK